MFWTAFIWGLGASCGAAFGIVLSVILLDCWKKIAKCEQIKRADQLAEMANAALVRRNELTEKQVEYLQTMTAALEDIELSCRK
jgi:hypothetical protein